MKIRTANIFNKRHPAGKRGFTLIEMLVSITIFSIVMTLALGALLALSVADRKAETLKSAIDNITFALDSMSRAIRTGQNYNCNDTTSLNPTDCVSGANYLTFLASSGIQTYYQFDTDNSVGNICGQPAGGTVGCLERKQTIGGVTGPWVPITSPDITIQNAGFLFRVLGAPSGSSGNTIQPRVIITVSGTVQVGSTQPPTSFHMQTFVTQRIYDQ
jgi:prepilin-type N-terminal cleavage/methylation domain-containing protein